MLLRIVAAALLAGLLAACGSGTKVTDGSGNPVVIGGPANTIGGPGSPGWPTYTPSQAGR